MVDFEHSYVNRSVGESVKGQAYIKGVESFCAMLKHVLKGILHQLSDKH